MVQLPPLVLKRFRRGGRFLHQRGILLRDFIHLRDGQIHLLDAPLCSVDAVATSLMRFVTRATASVTSVMVFPASFASDEPSWIFCTDALIRSSDFFRSTGRS